MLLVCTFEISTLTFGFSVSSKPRNEGNRRVSESQEQGEVKAQSSQNKRVNVVLCLDTSELICFKLNMMLGMTRLQFDSSLNDLGVHSRSQDHEKARIYAVIPLES